uniref:Putative e3 ubiquitin-protein ligase ubr7 n=1 Tax=Amblyomma triste TaxID=251400 RepID=A0A023GKE4_AMBTT
MAGVMADEGKPSGSAPSTSIDLHDEDSVTLQDLLDEEQELEEDADAVLGGSDDKNCTYDKGYVKRQALYACGTCTGPDAEPAGVCLACSYACHEGHNLYELYTKRNFRCDCGNESFPRSNPCRLCPRKDIRNADNKYNHNFRGRYCTCQRPYPDPEDDVDDMMLQCIMCEDWYHGRHIGGDMPKNRDYYEVVCTGCMNRHPFLWLYFAHEISLCEKDKSFGEDGSAKRDVEDSFSAPVAEQNGIKAEGATEDDLSASQESGIQVDIESTEVNGAHPIQQNVKRNGDVNLDRNLASCSSGEGSHVAVKDEKHGEDEGLPSSSTTECVLQRLRSSRGESVKEEPLDKCAYWPPNWRSRLCRCIQCLAMYNEQRCLYLLDEEDTVQSYEEKGQVARAEAGPPADPLMSALGTLGRVQQIEAIHGYNDLKSGLIDFFKKFADKRKVVKEEDVKEFFDEMHARKRQKTSTVPYFCR